MQKPTPESRDVPRSQKGPWSRIRRIQDLGSWWILDPSFQVLSWDPGDLGSHMLILSRDLDGSWILLFTLPRDPGILDPVFLLDPLYFRGSWLSWILMLCFSMGSRGSWVPNFWHCMRSWISTFGWSTSSSADAQVCTMCHICALSCIYWTCVSSASSNIQELINNNHHHEQNNIFMD